MREFDYGKLKSIKWDNEVLGLVAQIHEYKGKQTLLLPRQELNNSEIKKPRRETVTKKRFPVIGMLWL